MNSLLPRELPAALLRAENLPSLPAVALEVLRLTQDEESTVDDLAQCLSRDPALAAKLLKLSNSSLFGLGNKISTIQRATVVLGTKTVKMMSLSFSLTSDLPRSGRAAGFDLVEYWRRSLVRSVSARSFAELLGSRRADEAFLCGLLSHFGRLVLARALPETYEPVVSACRGWPTLAEEEERLGFTSADVCTTLLQAWQMPEHMVLSVACAERERELPAAVPPEVRELVSVLRLTLLAETVLCDAHKGPALQALRAELLRAAGLADAEVDALLIGLEAGIEETGRLLSLEMQPGASHEQLLDQARTQMVQVGLGTAIDLEEARRTNARLEEEARRLASEARTDGLTGLSNRAAFDEFLAAQVELRMREKRPLALGLILLDLDRFKSLNDTYGHAAGDEVLRMVGRVMRRLTRKEDFMARYGGEEFALILPSTSPHGLRSVAERVRTAIAKEGPTFEGTRLSVTASLGGACICELETREDGLALIKLADHHLYRAKEGGRNRTEIHPRVRFPGS